MSKHLEAALIQLGVDQPDLRPNIRPVLASLRQATLSYKDMDAQTLFSELRSAVGRNDVEAIVQIRVAFMTRHSGQPNQMAVKYLHDQIKGRAMRFNLGDMLRIYILKQGVITPVDVMVTADTATLRNSTAWPSRYYLLVKKPRGKAEGTVYSLGDDFMYQATMRTQTERVLWITSKT